MFDRSIVMGLLADSFLAAVAASIVYYNYRKWRHLLPIAPQYSEKDLAIKAKRSWKVLHKTSIMLFCVSLACVLMLGLVAGINNSPRDMYLGYYLYALLVAVALLAFAFYSGLRMYRWERQEQSYVPYSEG